MAFEQDITTLVHQSDRLTDAVAEQIGHIDARVKQAEDEADTYIKNARSELPFYRLSVNQVLNGTTGHVPDGWNSGAGVTYTLIQEVKTNTLWKDRTPMEQELLTAMGRENEQFIYHAFNIWRMDWAAGADPHTLFQQVNGATPITVAAMTKLLSGKIYANWAEGATDEWKLTGIYYGLAPHRYLHIHPYRLSGEGSMLFCLPAALAGYHPLTADLWSMFPYIGGTQND